LKGERWIALGALSGRRTGQRSGCAMAVLLNQPATAVDIDAAAYRPLLENLQGNILRPHGRNAARHVFIRFTKPAAQVRTWVREKIAPRVLTAAAQYDQAKQRSADPTIDGGVVILFFLSADGYRYLGLEPDSLKSKAFRRGMKDRSAGELGSKNKDPAVTAWEPGYRGVVHAMLAIADDAANEARLLNALSLATTQIEALGEIVAVESGRALRRTTQSPGGQAIHEPIEHFGYFDGISQPLFTKYDLDRHYEDGKGGTPGVGWEPDASLDLVLAKDPFTAEPEAYGSYIVFRKLAQDYDLFQGRVAACAAAINASVDLAGAMAVGRFKDGTPVVDSNVPGANYTNDFMFDDLDEDGFQCPRHGHIRKVNPRGTTPLTSLEKERRRRIARRGIPYGKPVPGISDAEQTDPDTTAARGLLFICYQANIEKQFEFIQRTWVDNPQFPVGFLAKDTGDDPLIGQDADEAQRWPKKWGDPSAGRKAFNFESAVTLKGGEYMYAPSLAFLRGV
jgi:Dyp-type peroxidase family